MPQKTARQVAGLSVEKCSVFLLLENGPFSVVESRLLMQVRFRCHPGSTVDTSIHFEVYPDYNPIFAARLAIEIIKHAFCFARRVLQVECLDSALADMN